MNLGKILRAVVTKARENSELALIVVGLIAPKAAAKVGPAIVAATAGVPLSRNEA